MIAETHVRIAARLYECRDTARSLFGDTYAATIAPWRDVLTTYCARHKVGTLEAACVLGERLSYDGGSVMLLMAAAVEEVEGAS